MLSRASERATAFSVRSYVVTLRESCCLRRNFLRRHQIVQNGGRERGVASFRRAAFLARADRPPWLQGRQMRLHLKCRKQPHLSPKMSERRSGRVRKENTLLDPKVFDLGSKRKKPGKAAAAAAEQPPPPSPPTPTPPPRSPTPPPLAPEEEPSRSRSTSPETDVSSSFDESEGPMTEQRQIAIVKKLYKDLSFAGAYGGIQTIQKSLLTQKGLDIKPRVIAEALNQFPSYVTVSSSSSSSCNQLKCRFISFTASPCHQTLPNGSL
jgi:hypothetical protein